jgi:hypothetical protein
LFCPRKIVCGTVLAFAFESLLELLTPSEQNRPNVLRLVYDMAIDADAPHPPGTNTVAFHRKQFFAERLGWGAMAMLLVWAMLGGFGDGGISSREVASDEGTCVVQYEGFCRRDAPTMMHLNLLHGTTGQSTYLHISREFLDAVRIERVTPEYRNMSAGEEGAVLQFDIKPGASDYSITMEYKPQHAGILHGMIRRDDEAGLPIDQIIYP